jgi:hypothetical protein
LTNIADEHGDDRSESIAKPPACRRFVMELARIVR